MQDGTESAGIIRQVDEDGKELIDALFFCKVEIEAAIDKLDLVLNDEAVVL